MQDLFPFSASLCSCSQEAAQDGEAVQRSGLEVRRVCVVGCQLPVDDQTLSLALFRLGGAARGARNTRLKAK